MAVTPLSRARILLIISGGIAAYKSLELIRRLKDRGATVQVVMTAAARQFISPLSAATLSGQAVRDDLFSLTDEAAIGHIELSRAADLIVDCAGERQYSGPDGRRSCRRYGDHVVAGDRQTRARGPGDERQDVAAPGDPPQSRSPQGRRRLFVGPESGPMACGEFGPGRMAEPPAIVEAIEQALAAEAAASDSLQAHMRFGSARRTACHCHFRPDLRADRPGPVPWKPVFWPPGACNCASAIGAGARVTLVTGPVGLSDPAGAEVIHVGSAREMRDAVEAALPADAFIAAAAVADWRAENVASQKIKKDAKETPTLRLVENPDILAEVAKKTTMRPAVVIGFAAETENITANAMAKLQRKGCDLIIANSVAEGTSTFGGETNQVQVIDARGVESWPPMTKAEVANGLFGVSPLNWRSDNDHDWLPSITTW